MRVVRGKSNNSIITKTKADDRIISVFTYLLLLMFTKEKRYNDDNMLITRETNDIVMMTRKEKMRKTLATYVIKMATKDKK